MISFAEKEEYTPKEIKTLYKASTLVGLVDGDFRCHELARAVGIFLGLEHQDGWFDMIEHTWLWTKPYYPNPLWSLNRDKIPKILDVYVPGGMPQVQLIPWGSFSLPWTRIYHPMPLPRNDINQAVVDNLVAEWKKLLGEDYRNQ